MEKFIIVNSINPSDTKANAQALINFSYNSLLNILINQNTAISNDTRRHFVIQITFEPENVVRILSIFKNKSLQLSSIMNIRRRTFIHKPSVSLFS